jgi:hypothetical protein
VFLYLLFRTIGAITLQEAKDCAGIENIVTIQDSLYQAFATNTSTTDAQTKEVLRYRQTLWEGYNNLEKRPLSTNTFVSIVQTIKENDAGIRNITGTGITRNDTIIYTPPEGEKINGLIENKNQYYKKLRAVTEKQDWKECILYMLKSVEETADYTLNKINTISTLTYETIALAKHRSPQVYISKN